MLARGADTGGRAGPDGRDQGLKFARRPPIEPAARFPAPSPHGGPEAETVRRVTIIPGGLSRVPHRQRGDCIGINFVSYSATQIVFTLNDWYREPGGRVDRA